MFKFIQNLKSLLLRWRADGQLELPGQGVVLPEALRTLRRTHKVFALNLEVDLAQISVHKVYLDERALNAKHLAYRLWQELDIDEFGFDEIFYDYFELESSIPLHSAYQFIFIRKERLQPLLNAIKKARFFIQKIIVNEYPQLNLLPWRERMRRRKICAVLLRLFLMPITVLSVLLLFHQNLLNRNEDLSHRLVLAYQQGLDHQVGHALTLKRFTPAFDLLQNLPLSVVINQIDWSLQGWVVRGDFTSMQVLGMLNQKLIQSQWLDSGMSVDARQMDGHYFWQFSSMRGINADSKL